MEQNEAFMGASTEICRKFHEKISAEVPGTKLLTLRFKQKFNKISAKFYVFSFNWPFLV